MSKWKRNKLKRLHRERNGRCFYCDCITVINDPFTTSKAGNVATIEHLYSNLDIRRMLLRNFDNVVLACASCNHSRAYREYDLVYNNGTYQDIDYSEIRSRYKNIVTEMFKNE